MPSIVTLAKLVWMTVAVVSAPDNPWHTRTLLEDQVQRCFRECRNFPVTDYTYLINDDAGSAQESFCQAQCVEGAAHAIRKRNVRALWQEMQDSPAQEQSASKLCVDACWRDKDYSASPLLTFLEKKDKYVVSDLENCLITCQENKHGE